MVKFLKQLSPYSVMLDVGGAILTVHSMRPNETEICLGGIERNVTVASALGEPQKMEGTVLYIRYNSTRDKESPYGGGLADSDRLPETKTGPMT